MNLYAANWIARVLSLIAILPLMLVAFAEYGHGPNGLREWIYLALFPFGFTASYFLAWHRPLSGGVLAISCLVVSWIVIGRLFPLGAYATWAGLCVPGLIFIRIGWFLRAEARLRLYGGGLNYN